MSIEIKQVDRVIKSDLDYMFPLVALHVASRVQCRHRNRVDEQSFVVTLLQGLFKADLPPHEVTFDEHDRGKVAANFEELNSVEVFL